MFRKASAHDLDAVVSIYDKIHAREDAGLSTIGWITGVYPIRQDAQASLARGDLYVYEQDGDMVWGRNYFGELKIVDVNIRRLRLKIEDNATNPVYITTVWGYGYKWGF